MNFRGCSGRQNRKARLYHSGETGDAGFVINWLKQQYPSAPLFAAGFSLGGNMLLKLAGEQGASLAVDALVSISAPIKLDTSTRYMVQGLPRLYQSYLLRALKRKVLKKYRLHDYQSIIGLDKRDLAACTDIREFDDKFTSRLHGFEDAQDYYNRCSAYPYIETIARPCLIIHAKDDPLAPSTILPEQTSLPDTVELEVTAYGGHAGFLGGSVFRPRYWVADRIMAYLSQFDQRN
jgi:predicted alpha/beta-fold hydrolase